MPVLKFREKKKQENRTEREWYREVLTEISMIGSILMWVNSTMYRIDHHVKYFNGPIIFSHHKLCCLSFPLDLCIWERERPDSILRAIECVCVAPHIKAPGTHPLPHNHISIDSHMLHINVHVFVCCSWILSILLHPSFYCRHIKELIFCGCVCVFASLPYIFPTYSE